jgi:hypothetical protein
LKGIAKIYYKQSQYIREARREILNYESAASAAHYPHPYHAHYPASPPAPPTTTAEVHQLEHSNEIFVIPSASSTAAADGQPALNF